MWRLPRHNRSQEELRELINDNKPLDRKKVIIRLTAFLILLGLAVTFITLGITRGGVKEGLQTIEAPLDETVPLYQLGVSFQHYFSGGTGEDDLFKAADRALYFVKEKGKNGYAFNLNGVIE